MAMIKFKIETELIDNSFDTAIIAPFEKYLKSNLFIKVILAPVAFLLGIFAIPAFLFVYLLRYLVFLQGFDGVSDIKHLHKAVKVLFWIFFPVGFICAYTLIFPVYIISWIFVIPCALISAIIMFCVPEPNIYKRMKLPTCQSVDDIDPKITDPESRKYAFALILLERCRRDNDNNNLLLSTMEEFVKLNISFYTPNSVLFIASERLKNDKEFIVEAIKRKAVPFKSPKHYIGKKLRQDKEFMETQQKKANY